jgi:hypothetical protein
MSGLPKHCAVGQVFVLHEAPAGQNIYFCARPGIFYQEINYTDYYPADVVGHSPPPIHPQPMPLFSDGWMILTIVAVMVGTLVLGKFWRKR